MATPNTALLTLQHLPTLLLLLHVNFKSLYRSLNLKLFIFISLRKFLKNTSILLSEPCDLLLELIDDSLLRNNLALRKRTRLVQPIPEMVSLFFQAMVLLRVMFHF